jgi:hypothetical protein
MSPLNRLDAAVARSARGLTRRRLLRNAGGAALGASLAMSLSGTKESRAAVLDAGGCSGSPQCSDTRCYADGGCHNTTQTKWRDYAGGSCTCASCSQHCWPSSYNGRATRCCDCCVDYNTGGSTCSSSSCGGGSWWRCHCWGYT